MKKLLREHVQPLIDLAIAEDIGSGDITSEAIFSPETPGKAEIISKDSGIFCGEDIPLWVYESAAPEVKAEAFFKDGSVIEQGDILFSVKGPVKGILAGERITLNFLQRMCGIATETARLNSKLDGSPTHILDTRKTLPGFRHIDKYAVSSGGGRNHRMGLFDMVLIKENHIAAAGGITSAVAKVREKYGSKYRIEVETENPGQVQEALDSGADIIMLDNMGVAEIKEALSIVNGRAETEISGNVTADRLKLLKEFSADYISVGAVTHSVRAFDLTMLIVVE